MNSQNTSIQLPERNSDDHHDYSDSNEYNTGFDAYPAIRRPLTPPQKKLRVRPLPKKNRKRKAQMSNSKKSKCKRRDSHSSSSSSSSSSCWLGLESSRDSFSEESQDNIWRMTKSGEENSWKLGKIVLQKYKGTLHRCRNKGKYFRRFPSTK